MEHAAFGQPIEEGFLGDVEVLGFPPEKQRITKQPVRIFLEQLIQLFFRKQQLARKRIGLLLERIPPRNHQGYGRVPVVPIEVEQQVRQFMRQREEALSETCVRHWNPASIPPRRR